MTLNRLLTNEDRDYYAKLIEKMKELSPEMMSRKIEGANVQQAFMLDVIGKEMEITYEFDQRKSLLILCAGCYEDTAMDALVKQGIQVVGIDPSINFDLHEYFNMAKESSFPGCNFDIVFSTSVIEHVEDDDQFLRDICSLLAYGGIGILTCDFNNNYKPGDKLPYSDVRFYTKKDFTRFKKILKESGCKLVDKPDWEGEPDFTHDGCNYSFAAFVFRKV